MHYPLGHLTNEELLRHVDSALAHDSVVMLLSDRMAELMRAASTYLDVCDNDEQHDPERVALTKAINGTP